MNCECCIKKLTNNYDPNSDGVYTKFRLLSAIYKLLKNKRYTINYYLFLEITCSYKLELRLNMTISI